MAVVGDVQIDLLGHCGYSCAPRYWGVGFWLTGTMQIATRIIAVQCLIGLLIAAVWLLRSQSAALAALCGAGTAVVPAVYLRWRMFQALRLADEPRELVGTVYRGQFGKFALTCVLFALSIARFPQEFLPVMTTFVACLTGYIFAGLLLDHDQ